MGYKKELRFNGLACRTNRGYPSEAEFKSASILIGHLPIQTGLLPYIGSFHAAKIGIFQLSSNFSPFISVFTPKSVSFSRCKDRNFSVIFQLFSIYFSFHSKERFFSDFFVPNRDWPQRLSFRTFGKKTAFFFGDFMELAYLCKRSSV